MRSGDLTFLCEGDYNITALSSTVYYPPIDTCKISMDLDLDDSTTANLDFRDTICVESSTIVDEDLIIGSDFGYLDSIVIEIKSGNLDGAFEGIIAPTSSIINVIQSGPQKLVLEASNSRCLIEFEELLKEVRYNNSSPSRMPGTRHLTITAYAEDQIATTTNSFVTFINSDLDIIVSIDSISCFDRSDGQIMLNFNYLPSDIIWSNGFSDSLISNLSAGNYSYEVIDRNGCKLLDTFSLLSPSEFQVNIENIGPLEYCGTEGMIRASEQSPEYTYLWNTGNAEPELNNLPPGTYILQTTNEKGCRALDSIRLTKSTIELSEEINACQGDSIFYEGLWYEQNTTFEDLIEAAQCDTIKMVSLLFDAPNSTSRIETLCVGDSLIIEGVLYKEAGTYDLVLESNIGCDSLVVLTIEEEICTSLDDVIFIPNVFSPNNDGTNDILEIQSSIPDLQINRISIYNRAGNIVYEDGSV